MENLIIESLMTYYGLDWLAMASGLLGTYLIGKKSKLAFPFWILAGICGLAVAMISLQFGFLIYNAVVIGLYFRGLKAWIREDEQAFVAAE